MRVKEVCASDGAAERHWKIAPEEAPEKTAAPGEERMPAPGVTDGRKPKDRFDAHRGQWTMMEASVAVVALSFARDAHVRM